MMSMVEDKDSYGIPEFCRRHGISTSFFFKLQAAGAGPHVMHVGCRTLISKEAAAQWRKEREAAAEAEKSANSDEGVIETRTVVTR